MPHQNRRLPVSPDSLALELFLGGLSIVWGSWLLLHPETFDTSPTFWWLASHGREWQYGASASVLGLLKILLAWRNRLTPASALLDVVFWGWIASGLYFANHATTGAATYGWVVVGNLYLARFGDRRQCP